MHTVIETPPYLADASRLFGEAERMAIIDIVSADPQCGVVIVSTGATTGVDNGQTRLR